MIFHLRWAFKNLAAHKKRTLKKISFILICLTVGMLSVALLEGTDRQMRDNLYYTLGDLSVVQRGKSSDLTEIYDDMSGRFGNDATVIRVYGHSGRILGSNGYGEILIKGIDPEFIPFLEKAVSWRDPAEMKMERGLIFLDAHLAKKIGAETDDAIILRVQADEGFINTVQLQVRTTYMGNPNLFGGTGFIHLNDMRDLFLNDSGVNELFVFFRQNQSAGDLSALSSHYSSRYPRYAKFNTKEQIGNHFAFKMFFYYRLFLGFILTTLILTFVIVMIFSLMNIYFVEFQGRRNELSTLLTFGMQPQTIKIIVLLETVIIFSIGVLVSLGLTMLLSEVISGITFTSLTLQPIIAILGGNSLALDMNWLGMIQFSGVILLFCLLAAFRASDRYLKLHIREILSAR